MESSAPELAVVNFGKSLIVPSVQELAKQPLTNIPPRYVRPNQDPPIVSNDSSSLPTVPIIDLQTLINGADLVDSELEKLHSASQNWGFFHIVNHGISSSILEEFKLEIENFFKLPLEEKKKLWQQPENHEGFGQLFVVSEEQKLDWSDMFYLTTLPMNLRQKDLFEKLPTKLRNVEMWAFIQEFYFAGLKAPKIFFKRGCLQMRMNYYPPCHEPNMVLGFTPHSDADALTIVYQLNETEGLQIRKDGKWISIKPLPNTFIVNIGDMVYGDIETLEAYSIEVKKLAMAILSQLVKALKMDINEMGDLFSHGVQTMRMNYYPPCPKPEMVLGFTPHSDADAITIVYQLNETEGLQIRKDGKWISIKPLPNAFVVNIGDMLEIASNGVYRSIEHRAIVNSKKERLSIATFYSCKLDAELRPAPRIISPHNPAIFRTVPVEKYFKDFYARELNGKSYLDFMKTGNGDG